MDVDQYNQPMAVDNTQPTQMLAPEMHHQAYGGFPDPTPMLCDGVNEASLFQANTNMHMLANGVVPDPSPSVYEQLVNDGEAELAAILWDIERGDNAGAAAAGAALNDVHPVKEDVFFRPIIRGQLDCSRCRSVREVVCLDERRKMHFMVHASEPGMIFQHAIVDRMSTRADGQLHTDVLLHHDLRGRNHEWVHNFIERSVEMMKRNRGQLQDTWSSNYAAVCTNVATAPPPSNHARLEQLEAMLNNILSAPASTAAAQPAVTPQEQQTTDAPGVAEAAAPHAAVTPQEQENTSDGPRLAETAAPEAADPAVTPQEQGENTDAQGVAKAAVPEAAEPAVTASQEQQTTDAPAVGETAVPAAAQHGVTAPQEQENTDAPAEGAEAAGPQAVQPAVSQKEENKDAGAVFAPFNWEGFQPEILESSLVPPYDPESGTNVLLYPSLMEQLRKTELERKESKRLSKMPALDTSTYLEMSGEDSANEPKLGSLASFRRLCQRDATYRLYSRRVNCINRKMTKLQQTAARVGPRGLFAIKQKMETYKREKADLYDMINKAIQENERGGNNGAGPSNRAEPSNRAGPSNETGTSNDAASPSNTAIPSSDGAGTSNDAAGPSNAAIPSSDGAGTSNDVAGPSNAAIPSSDGAGISNNDAGPSKSNTAIVPSSNCAGPSGSK
ncbi:uncharacterized protein [Miscanthus floridulus]|uniref:uncharacterized protein n=1 Tax=Miscanthus floridulus TaxID=154761 RepID=UPI00345992EF